MNKYAVVRNTGYSRAGVTLRQRHNERENETYSNKDIDLDMTGNNIYFKKPEGSYLEMFDKLVESGEISTRGLKPDADIFCEFVFDVNSEYFDVNGGYDYAKDFFEDAYRFAVEEAGEEKYIMSAVMHADEINDELSAERGYPVYHYHMHVVYIPVVEKEVRWSKRCKDPELRGKVKEVIHQVSRSKKWASQEVEAEDGKRIRILSYSLLQDRFYEYMSQYYDVDRGIEKSNQKHLSVLEYKTAKERENLERLQRSVDKEEAELEKIRQDLKEVSPQLNRYPETIQTRKTLSGKIEMSKPDYDYLCSLGREAIVSRQKVNDLKSEISSWKDAYRELQERFEALMDKVEPFLEALRLAPQKIKKALESIFREHYYERSVRSEINKNDYEL